MLENVESSVKRRKNANARRRFDKSRLSKRQKERKNSGN
jgi:hypothetical protein